MITLSAATIAALSQDNLYPVEFFEVLVTESNHIRICTHDTPIITDSKEYTGLAGGIQYSPVSDTAQAKDNSFSIQVSGILNSFRQTILAAPIKGSLMTYSRGFIIPETGLIADIPLVKWQGRVVSFSIVDNYDHGFEDTSVLSLECRSVGDSMKTAKNGTYTSMHGLGDFGKYAAQPLTGRFGKDN